MGKSSLYHTPQSELFEDSVLFEGTHIVSVSDKDHDANYWISLRYITPCQKTFSLEVTTFKKVMGQEFFDAFQKLVDEFTA